MRKTNLRLVEGNTYVRREAQIWRSENSEGDHSLHELTKFPHASPAQFARTFIQKYSAEGDTIIDPFCGSGTIMLEAALHGRRAIGADIDRLSAVVTSAKLSPADITEVTLFLQMINLKRPVPVQLFRERFSEFYDLETFRELVNLRQHLLSQSSKTARFVTALTLGVLHGHTASYLSTYTNPHIALSVEEQRKLNIKRHATPDYRSIVPRLLRKSAAVSQDGMTKQFRSSDGMHSVLTADARNLARIPNGSATLLLSTPPTLGPTPDSGDQWLRQWFIGTDRETPLAGEIAESLSSLEGWLDFMNAGLLEGARTVRCGGRAVLLLGEAKQGTQSIDLEEALRASIESNLSRFWEPEATWINVEQRATTAVGASRSPKGSRAPNRVLVLRRR